MLDSSLSDTAQLMRANAGQAVTLLRALSHGDRLLLLCALVEKEMCVTELQEQLGIQQPSLSQQLGVLRREGLVDTRREGKHIFYRVRPGPVLAILEILYEEFCGQSRDGDTANTTTQGQEEQ